MRKEKFSIRKFTVGTASVLVGAAILAGGANVDVKPASANSVDEVSVQQNDSKEEAKEYTVKYEVRDTEGNVLETLQTEAGWEDWAAMEQSSVVVANSYVENYGKWNVLATADGLTYVFTKAEDKEDDKGQEDAVKEYTVKYEVRDTEGNVLETLQTEAGWEDWAAMEQSSVVVADQFAEDHGKWDVEATADGLTYVFTKAEDKEDDKGQEDAVKEYTVKYEVRDTEGNVLETLQTEAGWEDWAAMEQSSVVVADQFAEDHGKWDVEATADGLTYVFTKVEDKEDKDEEAVKEYTVKYEVRDAEGNVLETLQTEKWDDNWEAMEKSSVVVADQFAEDHGKWDVEATADGLTYVFTKVEDKEDKDEEAVKEYTVKYEVRDAEGNVLETLQTEKWDDNWEAMEKSSVVVADQFAEDYGKWDVEATPEGLTYVFTKVEDKEDVDHAEVLGATPFDTEKAAILAGYEYLQNEDKNVEGHTGFKVNEFGGKYYVELTFNGEAPALPLEPAPEVDEDDAKAEELAKAKEEAIKAIEKAGVTSDFYKDLINKGKTVEGVNALRDEILEDVNRKNAIEAVKNLENLTEDEKQGFIDRIANHEGAQKVLDEANELNELRVGDEAVDNALETLTGLENLTADEKNEFANRILDGEDIEAVLLEAKSLNELRVGNEEVHNALETLIGLENLTADEKNEFANRILDGEDIDKVLAEAKELNDERAAKGTPVYNKKGEYIGYIKDGNIYDLDGNKLGKCEVEVEEGDKVVVEEDGKVAVEKKDGEKVAVVDEEGKEVVVEELPDTGEAQSGLLATAAALLGAAGLFLIGRRKSAEK